MTNPAYQSNSTERQWELIKTLFPDAKPGGRPRSVCLRAVFDATLYVLTSGCQWRLLPREFPHWRTVYGYFQAWQSDGTWERIHARLRRWTRRQARKRARPTAGSIDSQCVACTGVSGPRGYDAYKKIKGVKRHIVVDTLGLLLAVVVTPACVSDTTGAVLVLPYLGRCAHRLRALWCDGGYFEGARHAAAAQGVSLRVVKRLAEQQGFAPLPKRWVVERTFAWLSRCRRLARHYEQTRHSAQAFVLLAMTRLMLNRLAPA